MYGQGDDVGEPGLDPAPADLQDYARRHPMRVAILALLASGHGGQRSPAELHDELPEAPDLAVVEYHMRVLCKVGLVKCAGGVYRLDSTR